MTNKRRVFVVHGRNRRIRDSIFAFLRAVGLHPIEWSQAIEMTEEATPEISQVLTRAFSVAQAIVVVLSGDDLARLREEFLAQDEPEYERLATPQARPNVLFEAGLAFGSHPQRTILVQVGAIRPFSDIAGRHVLRLDNSSERRQELAQRLKIAGCEVELSGTDWHRVGDFEVSTQPPLKSSGPFPRSHGSNGKRKTSVLAALALLGEEISSDGDEHLWFTPAEVAARARMRTMAVEDLLSELKEEGSVEAKVTYDGRVDGKAIWYKLAAKGREALVAEKLI
jgi:hypothetical protein